MDTLLKPIVIIADDHALIRTGMRLLLQQLDSTLEVVEVATEKELHRAISEHQNQITCLFLDLGLPGCKGVMVLEHLGNSIPSDKICVLSGETNPVIIEQCMAWDIKGFIAKGLNDEALVAALRQVLAGNPCYSGVESLYKVENTKNNLSKKQAKILQHLAAGDAYEVVAKALGITVHGVHYHAREIFRKLNVKNRQQAVAKISDLV